MSKIVFCERITLKMKLIKHYLSQSKFDIAIKSNIR